MAIPSTRFESLPSDLFSKIAELSGNAPGTLASLSKKALQSIQQYNEFYKNRLQTIAKLEGYPIDRFSGLYPVDPLLKKHGINKNRLIDGNNGRPSLALQVKALYECYRKRISEIDPLNQYHLSLDDLPKLLAYDKAFNKIQLWKKLPGGSDYLNSEPIRNLTFTEQASQLRAWLESHPAVVNSVHSLDLTHLKLTSIPEELGLLTNLTYLNLSYNQITKIENLGTLTQLERLDLYDNQISKVENLDTLTQLRLLFLDNNQITKIENLDTLTQLRCLCLTNNQISKIKNLDALTHLTTLRLSDNQISKIENLNALALLQSLDLYGNQISKIENLDALTQLHTLFLNNNQISKIENLTTLTQLTSLMLNYNQISKIENLDTLTQLTGLILSNNQISKIENLDTLTQLRWLCLNNNQISKIENLDNLTQLKELQLQSNPIRFNCDLLRYAKQIKPSSVILKAPYQSFIPPVVKKIEGLVLDKLVLDEPSSYLFGLD